MKNLRITQNRIKVKYRYVRAEINANTAVYAQNLFQPVHSGMYKCIYIYIIPLCTPENFYEYRYVHFKITIPLCTIFVHSGIFKIVLFQNRFFMKPYMVSTHFVCLKDN